MKIIKLMADYQCHPLWDMTPGEYSDINPNDLPIPTNLKQQLTQWAHSYDATLNMDDPITSGFKSDSEKSEFVRIGNELGDKLAQELGPSFTIIVKIKD
jgi:hypothetical protein